MRNEAAWKQAASFASVLVPDYGLAGRLSSSTDTGAVPGT